MSLARKMLGFCDYTADFHLKKMLNGWSCEDNPRTDPREFLSPAILKGLQGTWRSVCTSAYEMVLFHALFHVGLLGGGAE